ncbi:carbohydrate kinase [Rhodonellum sp.]|uniref:carbohydrate kinase family protein n=1 Tax=Rhodonellum sp. TaxID=2231180 RepID=UPI0027227129|nr:carbohydrate kinase [Rhodonellum sp.]MDO9554840.1 carbohydrate kinase [Rhodonellum sp.]
MSKKVVCFGEMLWDCFPDYEIAGGAPMNVALNLQQLGLKIQMISRLGEDEKGIALRDFVSSYGLPTTLIQTDPVHPTGKVVVDNRDRENIRYTIVSPVAWDFIDLTEENKKAVDDAAAFIFGSLSVRNNKSWDTLHQLLHTKTLKIFDINLRAPFYDFEKIEIVLGFTDILKINEEELMIVADHFGISVEEEYSAFPINLNPNSKGGESFGISPVSQKLCEFLTQHFPIQMVCITLGSQGALLYQKGVFFQHAGYQVQVEDTVGSGDAFLSGFVKTYLEGSSPEEILDFACKLGAFVATKKGGTPKYRIEEIDKIS